MRATASPWARPRNALTDRQGRSPARISSWSCANRLECAVLAAIRRVITVGIAAHEEKTMRAPDKTPVQNPVQKSEDQWKRELTPEQYRVLRRHGTERAGTSPLNSEHREGTFFCAGCGEPLFDSSTKYDSG